MNQRKKTWIAGGILLLFGVLLLYALYPRTVVSLVGLGDDVSQCYVLVEGGSPGPSVDLNQDDLHSLLELFSKTRVQLCGRNMTEGDFNHATLYRLYFSNASNQFDVVIISDTNHIFYKGNEYRMLGENQGSIASFLKSSIHI